jgi:phospholipid/cholesterol/gamma-HCH transport system ATP-binding protein
MNEQPTTGSEHADAGTVPVIRVCGLTLAYGARVIQRDLAFTVNRGDIFVIMGGSGCGKSTLLRHLIGLQRPVAGEVFYGTVPFWQISASARREAMRGFGVLYQSGALWSSMTVAENVALPMQLYSDLPPEAIRERVAFKLALVGLAGCEACYPGELSGGMKKRAGLARALALDPEIVFFDEPSAGLDPVSAKRLDDLILELRESLGTTVVVVTHELASLFAIGTNGVFLDAEAQTQLALGAPQELLARSDDPRVIRFLTRDGDRPPETALPQQQAAILPEAKE